MAPVPGVPAATRQGNRGAEARVPHPLALWRSVLSAITRLPAFAINQIERDGARGAGFLCIPILLGAGAAFYFSLAWEPGGIALGILLAALLIAMWLARGRPFLILPLTACLIFTLGIVAAKLETWRASTSMLGSEITTRITGKVVRVEHQASGRFRLMIDVIDTERPKLRYAPERVRVTARKIPEGLQPGDDVSGLVRLMPPSGPVRPGSYDFGFASYFDGFGAIGFFMSGPEYAAGSHETPLSLLPARFLEQLRLALAERIRSSLSGPEREVAVAMIVGFRPGISEEVNEWLRRSGLAHILSISGLHMALVALTVMSILRATAALFPVFSSRVPVKKYAVAAALAFCTLYLSLSGMDVAAQRSYLMLAVMLAALLFDRAALTMRNVAIAAIIIVAYSPHEVIGPSFQMSFAATAALVAGFAGWTEWRRRRPRSGPPVGEPLLRRVIRMAIYSLAGLAATSLIAGTATALYGVWHFQRATPLALQANLVAMPFVSMFVMPGAVFAILAMPFGLEGFFLKIMGHGIVAVIEIAKWFSDRSPFDAVGLIPLSSLLAFTAALLILVASTTWLRILALPFLALGVFSLAQRDLPDVVIAEDARLIGIRAGEGVLAVNRVRPNSFTVTDWTRALKAEELLKPLTLKNAHHHDIDPQAGAAFICAEGLCLARHESGSIIAHAENIVAARNACGKAILIVIDDATAGDVCGSDAVSVITKRDLARQGAASARFTRKQGEHQTGPEITFSLGETWRPWHEYRAWSRPARGLGPYQRREKPPAKTAAPVNNAE